MDLLTKNGLSLTLTDVQEEQFLYDGFVKLENAFPQTTADEARAILWQESGCDPQNRSDERVTGPIFRPAIAAGSGAIC